jgi:hypothetical protein
VVGHPVGLVLPKEEIRTHTHTHRGKARWRHVKKVAIYKPQRETSEEAILPTP